MKKLSLTQPQNILTCINKLKRTKKLEERADNIITKLPTNSLTPIPTLSEMEYKTDSEIKLLNEAERAAVHIRRLEYSTGIKNKKKGKNQNKSDIKRLQKILFIQNWWKLIYKVIKIQKCFKGYLLRKHLEITLDKQEKLMTKLLNIQKLFKKLFFDRLIKNLNEWKKNKIFKEKISKFILKELRQSFCLWNSLNKYEKELENIKSIKKKTYKNLLSLDSANLIEKEKPNENHKCYPNEIMKLSPKNLKEELNDYSSNSDRENKNKEADLFRNHLEK
ncbi:MAG: hypothetical protein MJ252_19425, partial [archaeon]|nr:hypothetical protein [archaeon]